MAVKAPIADHAAVRMATEQKLNVVHGPEMRLAESFLFRTPGAGEAGFRHWIFSLVYARQIEQSVSWHFLSVPAGNLSYVA
jgi:hypothetical protein